MDFAQVESKYRELRRKYDAGAITEDEFRTQLEGLMIKDEEDRWWIIGYETGQWYYHDGEKWVQSEPSQLAERRREQAEALCQEGTAALASGDWEAAIERFEAALALEPGHPEAIKGLAEAKAREEVQKPEPKREPVAPPAAPGKVRWGRVVAGAIGLVVIVILIYLIFPPGPGPSPKPSPKVAFWADPEVIAPGECTVLHWEVEGVEGVFLYGPGFDPEAAEVPPGGEREICLEETATYELKDPDWEVIATVEVHVIPQGPKVAFWADPEVIAPGETTVLHWEVEGVEGVFLYGPDVPEAAEVPPVGEKEVCLEETTTYELRAPDWEVIATVVIEVHE